jgi:chemotaxis protein methyltransferase CheR
MSIVATAEVDADMAMIGRFVESRSAILLPAEKHYLFEARLRPVMRAHGIDGIPDLAARLRGNASSPLAEAVVEAMTTNETSFFRDVHPFEAMRTGIFPELIERRRPQRRLAVWSAACSTGQELYSVAMMLDSGFPELEGWDVTLHGTDLSGEVVDQAREGRYSALEVNRGLPAQHFARYLSREGTHYRTAAHLRARTTFERLNFIEPWPTLPRFDLVLCRNVLIYFDIEVRSQIIRRIRDVLAPEGYLMLGSAETSVGDVEGFTRSTVGRTTVFRKDVH